MPPGLPKFPIRFKTKEEAYWTMQAINAAHILKVPIDIMKYPVVWATDHEAYMEAEYEVDLMGPFEGYSWSSSVMKPSTINLDKDKVVGS